MHTATTLRALRLPRLWLGVWALMIVGVIVLSLMRGPPIPELLTTGKFDHFIAYFSLTVMAVQLYATRDVQFTAALAMIALGILMELAQGYLTTYRDMSMYDAVVDTFGVAMGFAVSWTPMANLLPRIEARFLPRH